VIHSWHSSCQLQPLVNIQSAQVVNIESAPTVLSNGGFYLAPRSDTIFNVSSANGFEGQMTGDALGITVCLYAYSHLSFGDGSEFTELCANHYHWLREYAMGHREVRSILRAID
ncbi:MAG: hypothetical protein BWK72_18670, partial [Rhodoferax ferrireducens]